MSITSYTLPASMEYPSSLFLDDFTLETPSEKFTEVPPPRPELKPKCNPDVFVPFFELPPPMYDISDLDMNSLDMGDIPFCSVLGSLGSPTQEVPQTMESSRTGGSPVAQNRTRSARKTQFYVVPRNFTSMSRKLSKSYNNLSGLESLEGNNNTSHYGNARTPNTEYMHLLGSHCGPEGENEKLTFATLSLGLLESNAQ